MHRTTRRSTRRSARRRGCEHDRPKAEPGRRDGRVRGLVRRAAAVPVAVVRRHDPAAAAGLPLQCRIRPGRAARHAGGRPDRRRRRRQGGQRRSRPEDGAHQGGDPDRSEICTQACRHARDPTPEVAARRDLRAAVVRRSERADAAGRRAPTPGSGRADRPARPDPLDLRPASPGRRSRRGCSRTGSPSPVAVRTSTTRSPSCIRSRPTSSRC